MLHRYILRSEFIEEETTKETPIFHVIRCPSTVCTKKRWNKFSVFVSFNPSSSHMLIFNSSKENDDDSMIMVTRVAEVAREHGWHPPKSLDSPENFKPEHTLFCREFRFVAIYALFGDLWAKKCLYGIYCIFHWVHFANLRLCAKTTHLSRKL